MPVVSRFRFGRSGRIAFALALTVSAAAWQGCVMDAPADPQSADLEAGAGAMTLQEKPSAPAKGVPVGCSREWSPTARDSVLFCPDIRPPAP